MARRVTATRRPGRIATHGLVTILAVAVTLGVWNATTEGQGETTATDVPTAVRHDVSAPDLPIDLETGPAEMPIAVPPVDRPRALARRVIEGDTIKSIAAEYSLSISAIIASNRLDEPDLIVPGQELIVPLVEGFVVEALPGETLDQLAERVGADPTELAQANTLPLDPDRALAADRLIVPGRERAERAAASPGQPVASKVQASKAGVGRPEPTGAAASTYEVQEGDTLAQLSARFGVNVWTIQTANGLASPELVRQGLQLRIPPVNGVEHRVQPGESLNEIASYYDVDRGSLMEINALSDPNALRVGDKLTVPGAERPQPTASLATLFALPPVVVPSGARPMLTAASNPTPPATGPTQAPTPARPAPSQAQPPRQAERVVPLAPSLTTSAPPRGLAPTAPRAPVSPPAVSGPTASSGKGSAVVAAAMRYLGARYVWGGTSPSGFDCSGFVWYVHRTAGRPVSRVLEGQLGGGQRISRDALQPGDTVFFANTYKPGLSHDGVYIEGGRFIHASDELSGVKISSLGDSYWGPRYVGATRLW